MFRRLLDVFMKVTGNSQYGWWAKYLWEDKYVWSATKEAAILGCRQRAMESKK